MTSPGGGDESHGAYHYFAEMLDLRNYIRLLVYFDETFMIMVSTTTRNLKNGSLSNLQLSNLADFLLDLRQLKPQICIQCRGILISTVMPRSAAFCGSWESIMNLIEYDHLSTLHCVSFSIFVFLFFLITEAPYLPHSELLC